MGLRTATLRAARMLSPTVRELTLDPGDGFAFKPGQWVSLKIPRPEGAPLPRSYSIASAPRADGTFDVAVTLVENGPGSAWLHAMRVGDAVTLADPMGFFTLPDERPRPVLMVATGTGVAPFRAMLQAEGLRAAPAPRFTLLFGTRHEDGVLYGEEFRALEAAGALRFEPTLSRAGDAWAGRRGYVQLHVPELAASLGGDCDVYVCGLNAMVREVRAVLKNALGLPRERIHTERYD